MNDVSVMNIMTLHGYINGGVKLLNDSKFFASFRLVPRYYNCGSKSKYNIVCLVPDKSMCQILYSEVDNFEHIFVRGTLISTQKLIIKKIFVPRLFKIFAIE